MEENTSRGILRDVKRNNKTNLIICLVIIIGMTFYYAFSGNSSIQLDIGDDALTVSDSADGYDFSVTIPYDEITDVYLMTADELGLGQRLTGFESKRLMFGTWESSVYGEVFVYAVPKLSEYMVIETPDTVLAINLESNQTTSSFFDSMCEMLQEKGCQFEVHPLTVSEQS